WTSGTTFWFGSSQTSTTRKSSEKTPSSRCALRRPSRWPRRPRRTPRRFRLQHPPSAGCPRDQDGDRVETVVVGAVEDEGRRVGVAETRPLLPVGGRHSVAQPRAPVALEDDALDVVAGRRRQRRPPLQEIRAKALHAEAGLADR